MRGRSSQWSRREFLVTVGAGVGLASLRGPSWLSAAAAAPEGDRRLVVLQLTGGNDALNMVVPYADDLYHRARPQLRIPVEQVLRLDDRFGLHPSMTALRALHDEGALAIVHGVGTPVPDRSHFRSMDIWHSADPEAPRPTSGWIGRAADAHAECQERLGGAAEGAAAAPFAWRVGGRDLPLLLRGRRSDTPTLEDLADLRWDLGAESEAARRRAVQAELLGVPRAERSGASPHSPEAVRRAWLGALRAAERSAAAIDATSAVEYPAGELGRRLSLAAAILASGLGARVVHLEQGGYDTHARQSQPHAILLGELSAALGAFFADLRARGITDRTLVLVHSEFGRRVAENASAGTDHGAAAPVLLLSGALRGGFHGEAPSLADLDDGDQRSTMDFRRVYATALEPWLGVAAAPIVGAAYRPLPII
jgi:uncharacterized protein (DUF1501 family)